MFDIAAARSLTQRELERLIRMASALEAADWERPTRCAGWTIADVCPHAGLAATQQAEGFRRALKGLLEPPEYPGAPDLSPVETLGLLRDGAHALDTALDQLDQDAIDGLTPMPFGVRPTVIAVQVTVYEYAFHADDVHTAVAGTDALPIDIAGPFIGFLAGLAPRLSARAAPGDPTHAYRLEAAAGSLTLAHGDGGWAAVEDTVTPLCTITGPDDAIALFAWGRVTADDPRLVLSGPAAAEAAAFKRWFPGP